MKIAIFSFFSGIGFLDLGFEDSEFDIVYVNEFHEPFLDGYKHSRKILGKEEPEYGYYLGDIASLLNGQAQSLAEKIESARRNYDLIGFIGGPPCPDFSVGGKNKGHTGKNGKLSDVYINLICLMKPDFFLFENVKGLWSTQKHRKFYDKIKKKVQSKGYVLTDKLINSIEFGSPQDRWRILLFGATKKALKYSENRKKIKDHLNGFNWDTHTLYTSKNAFEYPWPKTNPFVENSDMSAPNIIPIKLTAQAWFEKNKTNNHPNTEHCFTPRAGISIKPSM